MKIGTVLHGFELRSITPVEELETELHFFVHQKTGAELIWSKRNDNNKTFSVAFETLPENDTGVFHILEHSVLCGSEKYPVKEPFVELMKSSLNTFLNAITFPDKTMYPVSSRNDADFRNLASVYLDAVFKPAIYHNESIFMQEGWRLETNPENGEAQYIGVVFNEMKGALSSVDEVIETETNRMLFPDNCYGYVSGGDPKSIPNLTYQEFINNHRRFYHPSNARFFLDGNVQLETMLQDINDGYLCHFDRREPDFELKLQTPVQAQCKTVCYEVAPEEAANSKPHFALSKIAAAWTDCAKIAAANVLCDYLAGSNDAPLKREVLRMKLAEDLTLQVIPGGAQPTLTLHLRNVAEALDGLHGKVHGILAQIMADGLNHDDLTACLNRYEFRAREYKEPFGLYMNITMLQSWLYGGDPAMYLRQNEIFGVVRAMLDEGGFEALMQELLLDDTSMCELRVLPSATLGEEKMSAERERSASEYAAMTEAEKAVHAEKLDALHAWQQTPDSEEQLATLPHLELSDISDQPQWVAVSEETVDGVRVLRSPINANGMVFLRMYFPLGQISLEDAPVAKLMAQLLTQLPTKEHSVQELQREIKMHIGSLSCDFDALSCKGKPDECVSSILVNCSVLENKVDEAVRLIREVLLDTLFQQKDKIRELLQQFEIRTQQMLVMAGHDFAIKRTLSSFTAEYLINEHTAGYTAFNLLKDLNRSFDEKADDLIAKMEQLRARIFVSSNLTIGVTGHMTSEQLGSLIAALPAGEKKQLAASYQLPPKRDEAIAIPAGISFALIGASMPTLGFKYTGATRVLAKLISLAYLWNEIRVQGGAYGCGLILGGSDGELLYYSYRDPNAARSLGVYRNASAFIRSFCGTGSALDTIIIGTISDTEPLLSPKQQSNIAFNRYLRGDTLEEKRNERKEMLETTPEQMLSFCALLDAMAEKGSVCVVGSDAIIAQCDGLTKLA